MARFFRRHIFTEDDKAKAGEVNENFRDVERAINDVYTQQLATDSVRDAAIDYTSSDGLLVWGSGPLGGGTNGRIVAVSTEVSLDLSTNATGSFTQTFATDCIDGNPAFSAAPRLISYGMSTEETGSIAYAGFRIWASAVSSTVATIRWVREDLTDVTIQGLHLVWLGVRS